MPTTSWTDVAQAIAALIAIPGTFVTFIILIKKDKARQSEIQSLSEIAGKLTQMHQDSEYRYKNSKKPIVVARFERFEKESTIRLTFRNTNSGTTIKLFSIRTEFPDVNYNKSPIRDHKGEQYFSADLTVPQINFKKMTLGMEYVTEQNYEFFQYLTIEWNAGIKDYWHEFSPLMDKTQFHYLANDKN